MKKIIFIAILLLSFAVQAMPQHLQTINEATACQTAQAFANTKLNAKGETLTLVSDNNTYIYNVGNKGFVIIANNTAMPPVLGYSTQHNFPDLDEAPEHYVDWINHYSTMADYAITQDLKPEPTVQQQWNEALQGQFSTRNTTTVNPLITTHWNQDCYYNEYCPEAPGSGWWGGGGGPCDHVYAGCVACAMAQVMKYWNHPQTGFGSHSYIHSTYGEQSANFAATTYQWNDMPEQIYSHNDAVATLMYHCGVSVNMNYSPSGSGAQSKDVETALRSYFGYCGAKYREKDKYDNEVWIAMLKSELDLSHPMYYSGASSSAGHAFVCDGYDANDLFHFNFGWSGSADGYYSLYDVNGYSSSQAIVMNIVPMDIHADANGIIYVSDDGNGNGSSWANATSKLEYACCLSSGSNTKVWVKRGTYYGDDTDPVNAFIITPSNKVYGGFNGDEGPDFDLNERDLINNATILDGQGTKRVLNQEKFFSAGNRAVWDGFTIQNGVSGAGAGIYLNDYTTISNCIIRDNHSNGFGGGVYINSSTGTSQSQLVNCVITGNSASMGGGVCDRNSSVFTNCYISNNTASTKGGGVYLFNTDKPMLRGCIISNNTAMNGGGIYARGKCQFTNCNIVMNKAIEASGGIFIENKYSKYTNCIIWGNEANGVPNQFDGTASFEYCAVQGGVQGEGNINLPADNDGEEPGVYVRFVSPAAGTGVEYTEADWNIEPRSICLNAGIVSSANYATDIAGNPRFQHGCIEIGAYERNASLTLINEELPTGSSYLFNGRLLTEWGYYTTVYPQTDCDSVVGLTLEEYWSIETFDENLDGSTSIQLFDLTGRPVGNNLEHLAPGVYIERHYNGQAITTKKILVR